MICFLCQEHTDVAKYGVCPDCIEDLQLTGTAQE